MKGGHSGCLRPCLLEVKKKNEIEIIWYFSTFLSARKWSSPAFRYTSGYIKIYIYIHFLPDVNYWDIELPPYEMLAKREKKKEMRQGASPPGKLNIEV